MLLLLEHYHDLQKRGLQPSDVLLESAVVLAVVDAVSVRVWRGVGVGFIQKHLGQFN